MGRRGETVWADGRWESGRLFDRPDNVSGSDWRRNARDGTLKRQADDVDPSRLPSEDELPPPGPFSMKTALQLETELPLGQQTRASVTDGSRPITAVYELTPSAGNPLADKRLSRLTVASGDLKRRELPQGEGSHVLRVNRAASKKVSVLLCDPNHLTKDGRDRPINILANNFITQYGGWQ